MNRAAGDKIQGRYLMELYGFDEGLADEEKDHEIARIAAVVKADRVERELRWENEPT